MTTLLQRDALPGLDDLTAIVEEVDQELAASLREAIGREGDSPTVRLLGVHDDAVWHTTSSSSAEVIAVSIEWLHVSWAAAATRHRGATIVQLIRGGLAEDGWAQAEQHLLSIAATPQQAAAAALLIAAGAVPRLARTVDL